ncbi:MAG: hypothetical protein WC788_01160 [Candidatus Paceibacterota bacterium]|jgi:hypothetical protein
MVVLINGLFVLGAQFALNIGYISVQEAVMGIVFMGVFALWFMCDTYFAWKDLGYIN